MNLTKSLTIDKVNGNLLNINYAVRGRILERALEIEKELKTGVSKPFKSVVYGNLGDCQSLGKKPITFVRQVLALAVCPEFMSSPNIPDDVKDRVKEILNDCIKHSVGSYSPSVGLHVVREALASYLIKRDQVPSKAEDIFLGNGGADLIRTFFSMFIGDVDGRPPAVMLPIPQYPLFSGFLSEMGLRQVHYYLDEDRNWSLDATELERSWKQASVDSYVRVLVIINPGNPSGQILTPGNIEEIVKFAYKHNLFLLSDEVYQDNNIETFHSVKKIMYAMGDPYRNMELASFSSCSKGWVAESGLRAGFLELVGVNKEVVTAFERARSLLQCPNVLGQCGLLCLARPPQPDEPSYELYILERRPTEEALVERAAEAFAALNAIPGYTCNPTQGAMFAFPRIDIPERARLEAFKHNLLPDEFYCLQLLEETGVCVVPGSGFGQREGTYHFRTTILHPAEEFRHMLDSIRRFHLNFLQRYSVPNKKIHENGSISII